MELSSFTQCFEFEKKISTQQTESKFKEAVVGPQQQERHQALCLDDPGKGLTLANSLYVHAFLAG